MTSVSAVVATVRLRIIGFGLRYRRSARSEVTEIYSVRRSGHIGAPFLVDLMVPIGLRILVYIVGRHFPNSLEAIGQNY